ncbi:ABC transporter ATP-binding protein [Acidimangrovimonas sediminis]|uniref:ABC transporter ATP-binding protein n=1 Tax=Acidimangrovimonas sediminis TaxID=2056283 RepID=UPI000C7F9F45|nr:ABC transporter ATP-binding protein [Acidimangrovimonas sediminis]
MTQALTCRSIAKTLGGKQILKGLDLAVKPAEVVSLLGASGSGKTTLLRMIAGLMDPDAGEIALGERVVWSPALNIPAERRRIGMVFQDYALWPHMSVAENLAFGLRPQRLPAAEARARIDHALGATRMSPFRDRRPQDLSGGQQQRVAIARCLAARPALMLFDEPLSNLDAALREDMRTEMMSLVRREGITVVYVTHDQGEAMAMSDRIAVMRAGEIAQFDTPQRLYDAPADPFVAGFIGGFSLMAGEGCGGRFVPAGGETALLTDGSVADGAAVLVVRPEDVRPAEAHPATRIRGRVLNAAFHGRCWRLLVKTGGGLLRLDWPSHALAGDLITFSLPPARCRVLPAPATSNGKDTHGHPVDPAHTDRLVPGLHGRGRRGFHHRAGGRADP